MTRKLKRNVLWEKILASNIFDSPALSYDGIYWCVAFRDPTMLGGYGSISIGRNLKRAETWIERNKGSFYPQEVTQ